jgi:hypothetical protein
MQMINIVKLPILILLLHCCRNVSTSINVETPMTKTDNTTATTPTHSTIAIGVDICESMSGDVSLDYAIPTFEPIRTVRHTINDDVHDADKAKRELEEMERLSSALSSELSRIVRDQENLDTKVREFTERASRRREEFDKARDTLNGCISNYHEWVRFYDANMHMHRTGHGNIEDCLEPIPGRVRREQPVACHPHDLAAAGASLRERTENTRSTMIAYLEANRATEASFNAMRTALNERKRANDRGRRELERRATLPNRE